MMKKLIGRIQMMVCKALLASVDDTKEIQLVNIIALEGEVQNKLERLQEYGFTSNPPLNAECLVLYLGGNKDHGIVIKSGAGANRKKPLLPGEASVYTKFGNYLHLKTTGKNELYSVVGNDVIGFVNLGALGGVPLIKLTTTLTATWIDYYTKAAASWTALGGIPVLAGIKTTLDASADSALVMKTELASAQTTLVKGV